METGSQLRAPEPSEVARPWIDAYPPGVPPTYHYPTVPLTRFLDDAARDFPDVHATALGRRTVRTYARLLEDTDRLAAALQRLGLGPRQRLVVALPDHPGALVALFACWRLGSVAVPVDPADHGQVTAAVRRARPSVVIADRDAVPAVEHGRGPDTAVVVTGREDWLSSPVAQVRRLLARRSGSARAHESTTVELTRIIANVDAAVVQHRIDPDAVAVVLTGVDGAEASFSHSNAVAAAFQARLWVPDTQAGRERVLTLSHHATSHGLFTGILPAVLAAATVVFAGDDAGSAVERHRPTLLNAPAEAYGRLLETGVDAPTVRAGLAAPGGDTTRLRAFEDATGARVRETSGVAAAPLTHADPVYGRARRGGIGLPVTDTLAVVVDPGEPDRPLPAGEAGRLLVRGPQVAAGAAPGGWLVVAERATMHADGSFSVLDPEADA